jgi:hypothetical protein
MYIISPTTNNKALIYFINDTEKTEETARKHLPINVPYVFLNEEDFTIEKAFLEAYDFDATTGIKINLNKAKQIWLGHYRTSRIPLLSELDIKYMIADEQEDLTLKKEIASKKQALRDVTKTDLPNTLEEIKSTWPEILGQNPFNK